MKAAIVVELDLPDSEYPLHDTVTALRAFDVPHAVAFHAAIRESAEQVLAVFATDGEAS